MGSIEITLDYMIFDELHNIKGNNDYNNFVFCNKIINKSLTVEVLLKRYIINNEKKKKKLVFMKYFSYLNEILKENLKSYNKTVKNQNEFEKDEKNTKFYLCQYDYQKSALKEEDLYFNNFHNSIYCIRNQLFHFRNQQKQKSGNLNKIFTSKLDVIEVLYRKKQYKHHKLCRTIEQFSDTTKEIRMKIRIADLNVNAYYIMIYKFEEICAMILKFYKRKVDIFKIEAEMFSVINLTFLKYVRSMQIEFQKL